MTLPISSVGGVINLFKKLIMQRNNKCGDKEVVGGLKVRKNC